MSDYTYTEEVNGRGMMCRFDGPGLSRDCDSAKLESTYDADRLITMLAKAYSAGQKAARAEIRAALGLSQSHPDIYGNCSVSVKR